LMQSRITLINLVVVASIVDKSIKPAAAFHFLTPIFLE
jgi:hypothetical protein